MTVDWKVCAIALVLLGWGAAAFATDEQPSKWEFEAQPYGWLSGTFGSVNVKGHPVQIRDTGSELYGLLEDGDAFAGAGYFSARYDRWSVFADSMGGYVEARVNQTIPTRCCALSVRVTDNMHFAITDAAVGYRLGQWSLVGRRRPITLGVYAGTRTMFFGNRLDATVGLARGRPHSVSVSESFGWADPLIGVRWEVPVLDRISIAFRSDIGGFDASSNLIWGLVGDVRWWVPWTPSWMRSVQPYLAAGYRVVDFDRSKSVGSIGLQYRGGLAGLGFVF
jgi:hypothetical protein